MGGGIVWEIVLLSKAELNYKRLYKRREYITEIIMPNSNNANLDDYLYNRKTQGCIADNEEAKRLQQKDNNPSLFHLTSFEI